MTKSKGSIIGSGLLMIVISLLLFWLPLFGPAIAGHVGGKRAGSISRALLAAFLPGIILGLVVFTVFSAAGLPLIGIIAGLGLGVLIMVDEIALIAGAVIGGAIGN